MALSTDHIHSIAHLARLGLTDAEIIRYTDSLNQIMGLIDQLQAIDTTGVTPLAHALDVTQPLRPDSVTETNHRDDYQQIAPAVEAGLYLVPKVIE